MDAPMDAPSPPPARPAAASARTGAARGSSSPSSSSSSSPTAAFASAKMLDAQGYFQRVVKQELQVLLAGGVKREDAVRMLLHRIVESTEPPEPAAVRSVMRQFQMNYDDAVRALIVKQELGRLKRKGMDSFAAIEELTRKMQRIPAPSDADAAASVAETPDPAPTEAADESSGEENSRVEDTSLDAISVEETKEKAEQDAANASTDQEAVDPNAALEASCTDAATAAAAAAVAITAAQVHQDERDEEEEAEKDVEKQLNLSSLTLCQRIDKVSISSASTQASISGQSENVPTVSAGTVDAAGAQSPRSATTDNSANASTPPSASLRLGRKRRAPFGLHSRSNSNSSDGSISPERHVSVPSSLSSLSQDLYPSAKKQKRCEVGEDLRSALSRKAKHQAPPESPAASDSDANSFRTSGASSPSASAAANESLGRASSKNLVKRPRSSLHVPSALMAAGDSDDDDSPVLEHDDVLLIRHLRLRAKRHKSSASSSTGSTSSGNAGGRAHAQSASP